MTPLLIMTIPKNWLISTNFRSRLHLMGLACRSGKNQMVQEVLLYTEQTVFIQQFT